MCASHYQQSVPWNWYTHIKPRKHKERHGKSKVCSLEILNTLYIIFSLFQCTMITWAQGQRSHRKMIKVATTNKHIARTASLSWNIGHTILECYCFSERFMRNCWSLHISMFYIFNLQDPVMKRAKRPNPSTETGVQGSKNVVLELSSNLS